MKFSLQLLDSDSEIRNFILQELKVIMDKTLVKTLTKCEPKIRVMLRAAIRNEPEYNSLINGDLRRQFGIEDTSSVDSVIDSVVNTSQLSINKVNIGSYGLNGGIRLTIMPSDLSTIINDPSAFVVDNERGYSLPWLEWLLTKGGQIIVRNFEVKYGSNNKSRSGDALMIPSDINWRVPPQFAGTVSNNWITRALSMIEDKILQTLANEFSTSI